MSIRPLPGDVVAQIKSSVVITSLNSVVYGLVQNSLDGDASRITVSVDYSRGNCTVEDDGRGIPPAAFREDGGLGRLYYTSKYPPLAELHGRRGTFLASLSALSVMTIASHHRESRSHNALTIHNSKVAARNVPALPEQQLLTSASGTRVTVRDLFGSMPVRVKQRAIEVDRLASAKNFDQLVSSIVALLAAWPKAATVLIRDAGSRRTVSLQPSEGASRLEKLLVQADLVEEESLKSWVPLGASAPGVLVSGCISLTPVATKRLQFISLGVKPLLNEHASNILYDEINRVFANSSFGIVEQASIDDILGDSTKESKAKKGLDRWPVFCLKIDLGADSLDTDAFLDGSGHSELGIITDLLRMMAYEFLKKHHFQPRSVHAFQELKASPGSSQGTADHRSVKRRRENRNGAASRSSLALRPSRSRNSSPFTSWARVKSDRSSDKISSASVISPLAGDRGTEDHGEHSWAWSPLFTRPRKLLRQPSDGETPADEGPPTSAPETVSNTLAWVDPATKRKTRVDGMTGFMVKAPSGLRGRQDEIPPRVGLRDLPDLPSRMFKPAELAIPRIPDLLESLEMPVEHRDRQDVWGVPVDGRSGVASKALQGRISKDALRKADVIGQVDRKFILVRAYSTDSPGSMLVLIDQHAADERCRVEDLMRHYFVGGEKPEADTEVLEKPLRFELSKREGQLLGRFREHFRYWGISYDMTRNGQLEEGAYTVEIQALPPSIVERCRLEPRLLAELLRKEAWRMCDNPGMPDSASSKEHDWVARFHRCPAGIQELINSRACRSAIMFNDPLAAEECRQLVQRLAGCAFPFQCAHGRPSMVPLVDLGSGHVLGGAENVGEGMVGLHKLKKWAASR